ncbi:MAG: hypothetical protein KatS3mg103_0547 [Phycisphaerales bacterium]|nr:MAG: hypothetical protein KatS3mg103_0547 [Phycisphaerales bacterium]
MLLSSHLLADVEDVVDRMVVLYGGRIRRQGTREQLLEASDRTTIETDQLDEQTLAEIDRLIRQRSGGAKAVRRVAHPRQRLEDLFLQIVQEAQAERLETAGATHGGQTAGFLRADAQPEPAEGQALISDLVQADEPPASADGDEHQAETEPPQEVDEGLVRELAEQEDDAQDAPEEASVDMGVIGSLLGDQDESERSDASDRAEEAPKPGRPKAGREPDDDGGDGGSGGR